MQYINNSTKHLWQNRLFKSVYARAEAIFIINMLIEYMALMQNPDRPSLTISVINLFLGN